MVHEATADMGSGRLFYRHNDIDRNRDTLLFVHGLGESGHCFTEAFQERGLARMNILVPDLLGFGRSSAALDGDYSLSAQIARLCEWLDGLGIESVHLVGHSMGGDLGTLFCRDHAERIEAFVNVEGNLTPDSRFITRLAVEADKEDRFEQWLRADLRGLVEKWARSWPSCLRYAASLEMCQPEAFRQSAHEMYRLNEAKQGSTCSHLGEIYGTLSVPTVYCWGRQSLSPSAQDFLRNSGVDNKGFDHSFHWVMIDRREAFYRFLEAFLTSHRASRQPK